MKFFLLSIIAICSGLTWSQAGPIDFQSNGFGANWQWTTFENGSNPALEIVSNPNPSGINLSSTVAKFTAQVNGAPWAGFESVHGQGIGIFNLTAANCQIKMMVYKSVISPVGLKFATPAGGSTGEILVTNTLVNQWEELTFNFSAVINAPTSTGIDQIIVFPDFAQRSDNNICYIDNIKFSNQDGSQNLAPMVAAPTPTYPTAAVIALFSNPYNEVPVDTWQAPWSQAQVTDLLIQGNDTKRYSSMNFVGIETVGPNILDLSDMTHFRIDYWTANMNPFKVKLVDFGNDGQYAGGGLNVINHSGKQRLDFRKGAAVSGPGDGQSDDIPAMLADGEFVFPADVVAALGNGSTKAGSDKLYDMMHSIRAYHRSAKPKDLPPPAKKSPLDYLKKAKKARS